MILFVVKIGMAPNVYETPKGPECLYSMKYLISWIVLVLTLYLFI